MGHIGLGCAAASGRGALACIVYRDEGDAARDGDEAELALSAFPYARWELYRPAPFSRREGAELAPQICFLGDRLICAWTESSGARRRLVSRRSDDYGATWSDRLVLVDAPVAAGDGSLPFCRVCAYADSIVWIVCGSYAFQSTDRGASWSRQPDAARANDTAIGVVAARGGARLRPAPARASPAAGAWWMMATAPGAEAGADGRRVVLFGDGAVFESADARDDAPFEPVRCDPFVYSSSISSAPVPLCLFDHVCILLRWSTCGHGSMVRALTSDGRWEDAAAAPRIASRVGRTEMHGPLERILRARSAPARIPAEALEARDEMGRSAAHAAAAERRLDDLAIALWHDVDMECRDLFGCRPLDYVDDSALRSIAPRLMPHPQLCRPLLAAGRTLLHWACDAGHADIVDSLLARMTDPARAAAYVWRTFRADDHRRAFTKKMVAESTVDVRDARGSTPLHLACRAGRLDIVVKLLRVANADRIVPDADGRVAFELLEPRKIEILRLLLIRD